MLIQPVIDASVAFQSYFGGFGAVRQLWQETSGKRAFS